MVAPAPVVVPVGSAVTAPSLPVAPAAPKSPAVTGEFEITPDLDDVLAVLERRVGLRLGKHDVFVTVTGGFKLDDPGADLGVALAIASSFRSRPVLPRTLALGEVSLSGELRRVPRLDARLREAAQMGFVRAGFPRAQSADAEGAGLELEPLATLKEGCERLLGAKVEMPRPEPAAPRHDVRPSERFVTAVPAARGAGDASLDAGGEEMSEDDA